MTIGSRFGSSVGVPGRSGQSTRSCSASEPEGVAGPRLGDLDATLGRGGERRSLVGARRRESRVEDALDADAAQHGLRAADVVALRVGEHDRSQPPDAEVAELLRDLRLGRALVDEDRALGNLEQDRRRPGRRRGT